MFDTELAGRLAGFPRVGLATMVENLLGWRMEKDHSAADWSSRPLPQPWLRYAALDVELLIELRNALEAELDKQGKLAWAHEEFEHVRHGAGRGRIGRALAAGVGDSQDSAASATGDRSRRCGMPVTRSPATTDTSPSRLLPDLSIVGVATTTPASARELAGSPDFHGRGSRKYLTQWWAAIAEAQQLPDDELPELTRPSEGPPPAHRWAERDRAAADRLAAAKAVVAALADEHGLPAENLLAAGRRPPARVATSVGPARRTGRCRPSRSFGAREWQIALTAGPLARALLRAATHDEVAD